MTIIEASDTVQLLLSLADADTVRKQLQETRKRNTAQVHHYGAQNRAHEAERNLQGARDADLMLYVLYVLNDDFS